VLCLDFPAHPLGTCPVPGLFGDLNFLGRSPPLQVADFPHLHGMVVHLFVAGVPTRLCFFVIWLPCFVTKPSGNWFLLSTPAVVQVCLNLHQGCPDRGSAGSLIRKLSRISTNLKSAVWSSVKVRWTFKNSSNLTACICQNCKGQQPPPSSVPLFPCSKSDMFNLYFIYEICICIRPGSFFGVKAKLVTHFWTAKDL